MPVQRTFTDIDEHAAQMSGFEQRYVQLSPGAFRGVFSSLALPRGIGLDVEWVAQALHQQAAVPRDTVSLVTFLDLEGRALFNGRELKSFDTFVLPPGASLDVRTPQNARIAVVTLPVAVLAREGSAWAGPDGTVKAVEATRLLTGAACASVWAPVLAPLLSALETRPEALGDEARSATSRVDGLLDAALTLLCDAGPADDAPDIASARRRREAYVAAREAIDRLDPPEITIGALCRVAGVSRRTLEYSFDEAVAMSPLQYLRIKRLNGVRRDLLAPAPGTGTGTTIGDVAARHGIWHLSRLSRDYARLFGELPSATLRRGDRLRNPSHPSRR